MADPITKEGGRTVHFEQRPPARPKRDPMPIPTDFGVEGPFPPPIVVPWWLIPAVAVVAIVIAGALMRLKGIV